MPNIARKALEEDTGDASAQSVLDDDSAHSADGSDAGARSSDEDVRQ